MSAPWHFAAWDGFNGLDGDGKVSPDNEGCAGERVVHDEDNRIIACRGDDLDDDEWESFGALIAAAPELLSALRELERLREGCAHDELGAVCGKVVHTFVLKYRAAIAKAEVAR